MPTFEWKSKNQKRMICKALKFEVSHHPLKTNHVLFKKISNKGFIDDLSKWSAGFEEIDPLLKFEQMALDEDLVHADDEGIGVNYAKEWNTKRTIVLNRYTTGEKLTIVSSFLPGGEKTLIRQVSNLNEKVKNRLEQLDDFDDDSVRKTMGLSQQEFVTKINMLNDEIKKAWESEQRVKAFKIGIQCSKLLSDVNVMHFYPSKFILITDILDTFGNLVFDRLCEKSFGQKLVKPVQDINPKEVPETARETCQNWLYKMASIRELLPRLYMEMALLKCYSFTSKEEIKPTIVRLTAMIRGIGNPLVAIYLRAYLCKVASKLLGNECSDYFYENLKQFIEEYQQVYHVAMKKKYEGQLLTLDKYLNIYMPAVDWLFFGTLHSTNCKETLLDQMLQQCQKMQNNELLLCGILSAFDSKIIIKRSTKILDMIVESADKMVLVHDVLTSLGEHLCASENCRQVNSETLIQTWWKIASNIRSTVHFLQVLGPWLQFACTNLSTQHVNIILRGTIRYLIKCGKSADEFSGNLQIVIKRMLGSVPDIEECFLMDAFMPLIELVQTTNARTLMAKTVLSTFFTRYNSLHIDDHIVITSLMCLCCTLHDSINAITVDDEIKVCSELINKFVHAGTFHDDFEQQLNFYVECRSSFIKLDAVLVALVQKVNGLAIRAGDARNKWLQRACAAYCYITVPSLHCTITKAQLYLLSGQVALLNNCIGQAEANFKALIGLIPGIPEYILEDGQKKSTNVKVEGILRDFLSTLLVLPDNVDSNCKAYILSGLIKTMERVHWRKTDPRYYNTLLNILDLLSEMAQEDYAHHIDSVLSNDKLYGCDEEFVSVLDGYATDICQELLVVLKALGDNKETKKQYNLTLELFWRVIRRADLEQHSMLTLAANLWMLSKKIQDPNNKLAKSILSALRTSEDLASRQLLEKLEQGVQT